MFPSGGDRVSPTDTPPAFYQADLRGQHEKPQGMAMSGSNIEKDVEAVAQEEYSSISVSQKMISATWGSVLTSILVTPLDVVRIRLQSQTPVIRVPLPTSNLFKELPPNLGVSACCREVFWIGDNAQFCMVGPNNGGPSSNPGVTRPHFQPQGSGGSGSGSAGAVAADCAVEETQRKSFTSTLDGLRKIARNEGAPSLWRGLSPTLVMAIPANVIYFTGYDWLRYDQRSPIARYVEPNSVAFVAGSVARVAAASVISPIEMFRTRLQATSGHGTGHFRSTLQGLHQMTQTQGYSSLWRGLTLTMWRDVPFSGLYWLGYEAIKEAFAEMRTRALIRSNTALPHDLSPAAAAAAQESNATVFVESFAAGALSGAVAALITTPFDVGKTRQQVFHHAGDGAGSSGGSFTSFSSSSFSFLKKKVTSNTNMNTNTNTTVPPVRPESMSIPRFLLHILREEGTAGLFKGWAARCLKVAPACAIMISSYEIGKKMAGQANERRESDD